MVNSYQPWRGDFTAGPNRLTFSGLSPAELLATTKTAPPTPPTENNTLAAAASSFRMDWYSWPMESLVLFFASKRWEGKKL